jgi:hypothetical protein
MQAGLLTQVNNLDQHIKISEQAESRQADHDPINNPSGRLYLQMSLEPPEGTRFQGQE